MAGPLSLRRHGVSALLALSEIRQLREGGKTLRGIAAALNHRGLRTRRGSAWRLESVARITKQTAVGR